MENFSFRPSYDNERTPNAFLNPMATYSSNDHTKNSFKFEGFTNSNQRNQDFTKNRFNPYENSTFLAYNKEDEYFLDANDHTKADGFSHDYHNFGSQGHQEMSFDIPFSSKMQDYSIDSYRINRSRGPSFNLDRGRKGSEDIFSHGFDLLNYFKNHDQHEKVMANDSHDTRLHSGFFEDFISAPLMPNAQTGHMVAHVENHFQHGFHPGFENGMLKDTAVNPLAQGNQIAQNMQQSAQKIDETPEQFKGQNNLEPKTKKKRRMNNVQESEVPEPLSLKKSMSERPLSPDDDDSLQVKRTLTGKSNSKKSTGQKESKSRKIAEKKPLNGLAMKSIAEDFIDRDEKSTEISSNLSPYQRAEDLPSLLKSKSNITGSFGTFKKPETAQELLSGMTLPAEVEEYINNSKIFHQIKAPIQKRIGTLTLEERRAKIERYMEKRKRRTWNKRVNYDCRKKVADNRLRIKGRFVTKDQAFSMLASIGIFPDPDKITSNEIKEILTKRFGSILDKKKESDSGNEADGILGKRRFNSEDQGEFDTGSMISQDYSMGENFLKD
jgi:hypothetical protein